ncbi:class I SAM-dependent methyltransferase [Indioceanicola profundi]|uniref:class I SAM-dependent methyltransferase n=1 Tax=Indioceanicola profundi TaxID=2220096 RepID=UPI000E6AC15D|nr:class I SAM-dependent methyltransferase [Indioceanicola profundi]
MEAFFEANRTNWDERVAIHLKDATGVYRLAEFRAGIDTLHPIEAAEIGDIEGKRLVHLQCHFGKDTLTLARRGAVCTGLDFSPAAIAAARTLSAEVGVPARFVEGNVYDAPALIGERFDIVYVTWGAINWLPDLKRWAQVVADLLVPGGRFYLVESHPSILPFEQVEGVIRPHYDRRTPADRPLATDEQTSYTGAAETIRSTRTYEWIHPISDILNALIGAGLRLDFLNEHEELPYRLYPCMVPTGTGGMYRLPDGMPRLALSFSLQATKA